MAAARDTPYMRHSHKCMVVKYFYKNTSVLHQNYRTQYYFNKLTCLKGYKVIKPANCNTISIFLLRRTIHYTDGSGARGETKNGTGFS